MMKRGTIWVAVLLVGCFSEAGPKGSPPGGSTSTSTSDGTTTGATGSTSTDSATGSSGSTSGGSTGATTSGAGSTGEPGPPSYGPCNMLGACDGLLEQCLHPNGNTDVCGAPCETKADCPPPPPGQAVACLDLYPAVPGSECYLSCPEAGSETCPPPLTCINLSGNHICTEVP